MIVFTRTAGIAPGKTAAMIGFAHEIATYMKRSYSVELKVMLPIGGNPQRIAWAAEYKDLAALESVTQKLTDDRAYWEMVGKATDCFVSGSVHDSIWRQV